MKWLQFLNVFKKPQLLYVNTGRDGYVIYRDIRSEIKMYYEFGGGNCIAIISIPSTADWEKETNRSLSDRTAIITFVAERATKEQVSNGYYKITEDCIEIYKS